RSRTWPNATVRGEVNYVRIRDETNVQDNSVLHVEHEIHPLLLGNRVTVGHSVVLHGCTVEDECLIGIGAIVLNGVKVGAGSVVAAGAVVPEGMQIPPGSMVMGVPARVARHVDAGLRARIRGTWEHYVAEAERHRRGAFPLERPTL